ncbi:MAG TPA: HAMP domain-containing sensor histidine kinase [Polyangia bacterium]|jgi:signal transduction histidine kinase|nr:HAMP domain-containing sensor histidine kinase [Polyangia bacterium]
MLHEFLASNREEILARSRTKLVAREAPTPTPAELAEGLPLFLDQIAATLRADKGDRSAGHHRVAASARVRGGELLRIGLTVGQVVHDYGSICQSVTELADERSVAITADEFQTFNRCLDDAIAEAVTTFEDQRDHGVGEQRATHLGFLAHEMRNLLTTSMLTFDALSRGSVGVQGSTGALLGRSLRRMRALIDRTLAEVRLGAGTQKSEPIQVAELIEEVEVLAMLEATDRQAKLSVDAGAHGVIVLGDPQILVSVIANLVQNAFKFSRARGQITVRAHTKGDRVLIDVEDECGGLPPGKAQELFRPFAQHSVDRTGMGLGLVISQQGAKASGGEIHVRDVPGTGCVFTLDLPRAPAGS